MSVNPGFSGQTFINTSYKKLLEAIKLILDQEAHCSLGIDGGINISNIASVISHGATEIAAAQAVFSAPNPIQGLHALMNAIEH
jgi:ribulose-phosphate 3-epimerase